MASRRVNVVPGHKFSSSKSIGELRERQKLHATSAALKGEKSGAIGYMLYVLSAEPLFRDLCLPISHKEQSPISLSIGADKGRFGH